MRQPPRPSDHDLTNASRLLPNGDLLPNGVVVAEPPFLDHVVMNLIAMGHGLTALNLTRADELLIEAAFEEGIGAGDLAQIIADGILQNVRSRWEP